MGDHRRVSLREFPPNNRFLNPNYVNIPPPPLPPRFPPLPVPSVPPPPPMCPEHPLYPDQLPPPSSGRPVYAPPSWDSGLLHPPTLVNQQPAMREQSTQDSENAQDWVDHWAKNREKSIVVKSDVKIHTVREKLAAAFKLVRELENSSRTLGVMVKTVSSAEWAEKCNEVEEKKIKLTSLFNEIKLTEADFKSLREKLSKRTKKRARLRRQSERLKKQREEEEVRVQNLQFQIDSWQKEMQEGVERVKREEELKKEADAVLWGVTKKKTEAKRQVAMLSALLTLRSVRVARLTAAGLPVSQSQIDTFNTVIERLKTMWSRQLEQCQLEEQALRGMLGAPPLRDPAMDAVRSHRRLVLGEWEAAILGPVGAPEPALRPEELLDVRCAWDRFAVREPSLLASAVPPGYVLPVAPSSDLWRTFLKH